MILLDTNVLMYAAGARHPHKAPSARLLARIARGEFEATINAETLQEILHRYRAIRRWDDGKQVYDLSRQLFPSVVPITGEVLDHARQLLDEFRGLMARDALHAAVVLREGFDAICSYDQDFDQITALTRIEP